jgi:hypothetical protein
MDGRYLSESKASLMCDTLMKWGLSLAGTVVGLAQAPFNIDIQFFPT